MNNRIERASLRHAEAYLAEFLAMVEAYRDGSEPIDDLIDRMSRRMPQISGGYEWCTKTIVFKSEASPDTGKSQSQNPKSHARFNHEEWTSR